MNSNQRIRLANVLGLLAAMGVGFSQSLQADVVVLESGAVVTGKVLQQDAGGVLMQTEYGTYRYPLAWLKDVKRETASAPHLANNGRAIPDWAQIVSVLATNGWAEGLRQVPATVINYGDFNRIPYVSFRCASGGYELNIFGDLNAPAAVQLGAMGYLKDNPAARSNCVSFICSVLPDAADRKLVRALDFNKKDTTQNGALKIETLLPGEWGSYGGWWVSVRNTDALASAAASEAELNDLTRASVPAAPSGTATTNEDAPVVAAAPISEAQPVVTTATTTYANYYYWRRYPYNWVPDELVNARPLPVTVAPENPVDTTRPAAPETGARPAGAEERVYPRTYTRERGSYGFRRR